MRIDYLSEKYHGAYYREGDVVLANTDLKYLLTIANIARDLVDKTPEDQIDIFGLKKAIYGDGE